MSVKFFFISFAGDTGDMKSLKNYTNVRVKPKSAGLLTRHFDSKGAPLFLDIFAGDTGDTGDMKTLKIYTNVQVKPKSAGLLTRQFDSKGSPFSGFFCW